MATRPVFTADTKAPFVAEVDVDFEFHPGFSIQQKQRSIASLHKSFITNNPEVQVLEVSSKSSTEIGVKLSAFNLKIRHLGIGDYSVESAFQASKVFDNGGPFDDLLFTPSREAKRDPRLKDSGQLRGFKFFSRDFPLEPKTYFYDWLYASALWRNKELLAEAVQFDAFTDIEYNPKKSINCQARSIAKVVGLWRRKLLLAALEDPKNFLLIGYSDNVEASENQYKGTNEDELIRQSLF